MVTSTFQDQAAMRQRKTRENDVPDGGVRCENAEGGFRNA